MVPVDSASKLKQLLRESEAIAFIHFNWSGQSVQSLKVVEELERILWINAKVYHLDPYHQVETAEWLGTRPVDYVAGG